MQTTTEETIIDRKTRELCQAILDEPALRSARLNIEAFIADNKARSQYEELMAKGQALRQKQQHSQQLTQEEIDAFENGRKTLLQNPVARNFLDAQEQLHHVHESINQHVSKTLELGRMPTEEDMG